MSKIRQDTIENVIQMRARGYGFNQIAKCLHISSKSVAKIVKREVKKYALETQSRFQFN